MHLRYQFVDIDPEGLRLRRLLLDNYAQFAQLSILLIPLIYQLAFGIRLISRQFVLYSAHRRLPPGDSLDVPKHNWKWSWDRVKWAFGDEISPGQGLGTGYQWLFGGLWAAWLASLVISDTGNDYLHLTKRFGLVAVSQLPFHFLLVAKSWSPVQFLICMSHEQLNVFHRILGQIISLFLACHALLYLNFYAQRGILLKRLQDFDVLMGLFATLCIILLFSSALGSIRRLSYRLFFYTHVFCAIALLLFLYLHVSHARKFVIETAFVFIFVVIQRRLVQSTVPATIVRLPNTNLLHLNLSIPNAFRKRQPRPGDHIFLGFPSLLQKLRLNPFTIANYSKDSVQLVIRPLHGTTAMLEQLSCPSVDGCQQPRACPNSIPLVIEGPYGSAQYHPDFANEGYTQILLVAGGVGATYTLPIFEALLSKSNHKLILHFVWSVRELDDISWALHRLAVHADAENVHTSIYVTHKATELQLTPSRALGSPLDSPEIQRAIISALNIANDSHSHTIATLPVDNSQQSRHDSDDEDAGPPIELHRLLPNESETSNKGDTTQDQLRAYLESHLHTGRPDIYRIVDNVFRPVECKSPVDGAGDKIANQQELHTACEKVAVLVCGPPSLSQDLRAAVGRWVDGTNTIFYHAENFAW